MAIKVIFLCTGNSARSQMAEAFLREFGDGRFESYSAGIAPKEINPLTIRVMQESGFDMLDHRSKGVDEFLGKVHFQYLVTLCDDAEQNCPRVWPGINQRLHWSFEDPAAFEGPEDEKLDRFRKVRDQIRVKILSWLYEIAENSIELTEM